MKKLLLLLLLISFLGCAQEAGFLYRGRYNPTLPYIEFDGSTGYVTVGDHANLDFGTNDFSISFWIKTTDTTGYIFKKNDGVNLITIHAYLNGGVVTFQFTNIATGGSWVYSIADSAIATGQWLHVVIVKDTEVRLYLDSSSASLTQVAKNADPIIENNVDLVLASGLSCSIDDFRIYKAALTTDEISNIYNNGVRKVYDLTDTPISGAASVAFNMNEKRGTSITDEIVPLTGNFTGGVTWHKSDKTKWRRERFE